MVDDRSGREKVDDAGGCVKQWFSTGVSRHTTVPRDCLGVPREVLLNIENSVFGEVAEVVVVVKCLSVP